MYRKTITTIVLITGVVFTAGLAVSFVIPAFAGDPVEGLEITIEQIPGGRVSGKNYNSSLSNKSVGLVRMEVGNILLGYGIGGEDINKVTDALEGGGVYEAELKSFLISIGISEEGIQKILAEFDKLGIGSTGGAVSAPAAGDAVPSSAEGTIKEILPSGIPSKQAQLESAITPQQESRTVRKTGSQGDYFPMQNFMLEIDGVIQAGFKEILGIESETEIIEFKDGDDMTIRNRPGLTKYSNIVLKRGFINDPAVIEWIKNGSTQRKSGSVIVLDRAGQEVMRYNLFEAWPLKWTEPVFDADSNIYAIEEIELAVEQIYKVVAKEESEALQAQRKYYRRVLLQQGVQESRKALKENAKELRENFRKNISITIFKQDKSGVARIALAHGKGLRMLNRFRSAMARFDHILGRLESRILKLEAQGIDVSSAVLLIEEAKNMQVENEAKMEELKAKYESLLLGENVRGVAEEARVIATELKVGIENLHDKLREIATDKDSILRFKGF